MSFKETLEILIDELEDDKPFLNKQQQALLAKYYEMLAKEWYEQHYYEPPQKTPRKLSG
jgi:hypothetical protein